MADKKISQLTSAATPLAGTEVLPVVQSGATVKVTAENLVKTTQPSSTAKTVPYLNTSKIPTNGVELQFDGANFGMGVSPTVPSQGISFEMDGGACLYSRTVGGVPQVYLSSNAVGTGFSPVYKQNGFAAQYVFQGFDGSHAWSTAPSGTAGNAVSFTTRMTISAAGNITASTGNIILATAGKGIDFSANANAPGMTSELLNDYEEGTWTPNQGGGLTVVGAFSSGGTYTKIGRLVTVNFFFAGATSVAAAAGGNMCTNLPFTTLNVNAHNPGTMSNNALSAGAFCAAERNTTNVWATSAMAATSIISCSITYPV